MFDESKEMPSCDGKHLCARRCGDGIGRNTKDQVNEKYVGVSS
jgi:hypothetical protein